MSLPLSVRTPARYLGNEVNLPRKPFREGMLRVALSFADVYEVGMSHIGLKILYHILNERDDVFCERVFAPWTDMMQIMEERGAPLTSLETRTPLNAFDVVGFSLQYEMSYPTLLTMLEMGGIPMRSEERVEGDPFVLAGGPCAVNPEPLALFIDAFVIGDGERAILEVAECLKRARETREKRSLTLETLAGIEGVYVPAFFDVACDVSGRPTNIRNLKGDGPVRRRIEGNISDLPFPTREVVPIIRAVHDRYAVEIARGCLQGCRFCQAGFIYRPYRERDEADVLQLMREGLRETGYSECSFLSLSAGDYSRISTLLEVAVSRNLSSMVSISLPSLRIASLKPSMVEQIKAIRKTGFTLAPEAGTQRLRDVINKKIDEDEIFSAIETIFKAGWHLVKLYFMIGLPTEQPEDVEGIVSLVTQAWRMARRISRKNEVTVSISTFVPKPHTPFQWCEMAPVEEIREKQMVLRQRLSRRGVRVKWHDARLSFWEGVISRAGRTLGEFLAEVAKKGAYLDGWTDRFNQEIWDGVAAGFDSTVIRSGLDKWGREAVLPWDGVDIGVRKEYLWEEYQRALSASLSPPCPRSGRCQRCGVCDKDRGISVRLSRSQTAAIGEKGKQDTVEPGQDVNAFFHATFVKIGNARYLGHLDTARAILMAARRSGFPMAYSRGFHPAPRVRFSTPLPLGMESLCETVEFALTRMIDPIEAKTTMNSHLPNGVRLTRVRASNLKNTEGFDIFNIYSYICLFRIFKMDEGSRILNLARQISVGEIKNFRAPSKKGPVDLNIPECLVIEAIRQTRRWLRIDVRIGNLPRGVRPFNIIAALFGMTGQRGGEMRMIKVRGIGTP